MSTSNPITLDTFIVRNNEFIMTEIDDELVCFDETSGSYYGLNHTGKTIWELINTPISVKKIIDVVQKRYPDTQTIADDILHYLNALYGANNKNRLITLQCTGGL